MTGKRVGYVRVSSIDQNTDRQLDGVVLDRTFTDHASGKDTKRPELQAALSYLREGDVLIIHSMDRLARSLSDLLQIVDGLTKRGVVVEFMKEHLTFTGDDTPMSKFMLAIIGAMSEFERSLIRERQREGIIIAREKKLFKGSSQLFSDAQIRDMIDRVERGETITKVINDVGQYNVKRRNGNLVTEISRMGFIVMRRRYIKKHPEIISVYPRLEPQQTAA
jgi:DNA invertase Pin-like site-specific DNA recombinase